MSLESITFPRIVIALSLVGSAVLAWFDFTLGNELAQRTEENDRTAPLAVRRIQEHSHVLKQLQEQLEDDKWSGQNNPGSYVRAIAQHDDVRLGQVSVTPSSPDNLGNGIVDQKYTIKPDSNDRGWSQSAIGNFLYKLEADSPRVRVTRIKLQPPSKKRYKPHDFPDNEWTYEVEITSRQRQEPGS